MAEGFLGGLSDFAGGVGDFFTGGGKYADPKNINPSYGVPEADVRQAAFNTLGNVGGILLGAGQSMTGAQRGQLLAQLGPALGGMNTDIYKSSQARLMNAQQQGAMREMEENKALSAWAQNPENLKSVGLTPEQFRVVGTSGLKEIVKNTTLAAAKITPAQRAADAAIARIVSGEPAPSPTPMQPQVAVPTAAPATTQTQEQVATPAQQAPPRQAMSGEDMARAVAENPAVIFGRPEVAKNLAQISDSLGKESREVRTAMQKEYLKPIFERASSINSLIPALDAAERAIQAVPGGPAAQALNYYGKVASSLGLPVPEGSAQASILSSIGTQLAPIFKLPGAVSNAEMSLYTTAGPSLGDTPEANKLKIDLMRALGARAKSIADIGYRYGGKPELFDKLAELDKPVFTDDQRKRLEQAAGISTPAARQPAAAPVGRARVLRVIGQE
jgi:hypothetical protein